MAGYIFSHFVGDDNDGEQIYFSLSRDGLHWQDAHDGAEILRTTLGTQGARDPFLVYDALREKYVLIATDLRIETIRDWNLANTAGSRDLLIWESDDLIHWGKERAVPLGVSGAGCVWAPECIYDREKRAFLVFWASNIRLEGEAARKQRIYAAYTTDFSQFTTPFVYMERKNHVIDTTITYDDGWYYRFSKDETTKVILMERAQSLNGTFEPIDVSALAKLYGVEGPEIYRLPDGRWCLIVDQFAKHAGYLPLVTDNLAHGAFTILPQTEYDMGKTRKRHGGVLAVPDEVFAELESYYLSSQQGNKLKEDGTFHGQEIQ